jgi:hypothetical protein
MSRTPAGESTPDIASLLEAERILVPEPDDLRYRAIHRARAVVLHSNPMGLAEEGRIVRSYFFTKAAAAVLLLVGMTAAAYELGYRQSKGQSEGAIPRVAPPPATNPSPVEPVGATEAVSDPVVVPPRPVSRHRKGAVAPTHDRGNDKSNDYAKELRLLRPAQAALAQSSFARALGLVEEHRRRFPMGHFAEEREALRVKSLLGLHRRDEAQRAVDAFRREFPESALSKRIEGMLGTGP